MAYTRRRRVYRRRPGRRVYRKKGGALRRTMRGSQFYNNPLGLLQLRRHFSGSSGGPKPRGFIRDFRKRDVPWNAKVGRFVNRTKGRIASGVLSTLGVPFLPDLVDKYYSSQGDEITDYWKNQNKPLWSPSEQDTLDILTEMQDDGILRSGNKAVDTYLSLYDGDKRNTYFNLSPSQIASGAKSAYKAYNQASPYLQSLINEAPSLDDIRKQSAEYFAWKRGGSQYDDSYQPDDRTYLQKYSPSILLDLLSPNREESFESAPRNARTASSLEKNIQRAINYMSPYKAPSTYKRDQLMAEKEYNNFLNEDHDDPSVEEIIIPRPKKKKIRVPTPVPDKRYGPPKVLITKKSDYGIHSDDDIPDLEDKYGNVTVHYI